MFSYGNCILIFSPHYAQALGNIYIFHERVEPIFLWDFEGIQHYQCLYLLVHCLCHSFLFSSFSFILHTSHSPSLLYIPSAPPPPPPSLPSAKSFIEVTGEVLEFDTLSPGHCHKKTRFPNDFYPDVRSLLWHLKTVQRVFLELLKGNNCGSGQPAGE